jgi:anionic cell wall polymer biosynthesis LytR-Cps2A-Psr (LCP) family protein
VSLVVLLVLVTSLGDAATVAAASAPNQRELLGWLRTLSAPVAPVADLIGTNALDDGDDGRLTVLVLGSDTRTYGFGLTDAILIASIDQSTNAVSIASIPRDIGKFPNPNGGSYVGKVNNLVKKIGMADFEKAVEFALDIEVDYNVWITFRGFESLVDNVDNAFGSTAAGIKVNNPATIADPKFWDDPNKPKGIYIPASSSYTLYARPTGPLCNGLYKTRGTSSIYWCRRALPFVRSRKGPGNSDFVRAKRQQNFLFAVVKRVISRGSGSNLTSLASAVNAQENVNQVRGTLLDASHWSLFSELAGANLSRQVVFAPNTYATKIPNTSSYELKLSVVRGWTDLYMS